MSEDKKGIFIKPKAKGAPAASALNKPKDVKKRWLVVGGLLIGTVVVSSTLFGDKKNNQMQAVKAEPTKPSISVNPPDNEKKAFQAQYSENQTKIEEELRKTKEEMANLKKLMEDKANSQAATTPNSSSTLPPNITPPPVEGPGNTATSSKPPAPPELIDRSGKPLEINPKNASGSSSTGVIGVPEIKQKKSGPLIFQVPEDSNSGSSSGNKPQASSGSVLENAIASGSNAAGAVAAKMSYKKNPGAGTLVAGAFAPIALLNGIDAGTSQATQSNPMPVLMNVTDQAILPGSAKYKLKSCFILGTGYGDLSAERVYIRTSRLSCIDKAGRLVLSQSVPGYIVDSDNKLGMRGVITDKQGAKLGKALLAGFAQGLAGALGQAQGTVYQNTSTGVNTTSITGGAALRASGLQGAQSAINILAETYVKDAQNLFPIITIDAGRQGTVVFTDTVVLTWTDGDSTYVQETTPVNNK